MASGIRAKAVLLVAVLSNVSALCSYAMAAEEDQRFSEENWTRYNQKAAMAVKIGSLEQADRYCKQALSEAGKPGGDQECLVDSLRTLAGISMKRGNLTEAAALYERCLAQMQKQFGKESQRLDQVLDQLSSIYRLLGRNSQAEEMMSRLLALREKTLGPEDPKLLSTMHYLADVKARLRRVAEAEKLARRVMAIRERQQSSANLAVSIELVAELLSAQKKWEEAERLYKRELEVLLKSAPGNAAWIVGLYRQIGRCEMAQENFAEAEPYLRKGLELLEKQKWKKDGDINSIVQPLARSLLCQKKFAEAEVIFKRRLSLEEKIAGESSPGVVRTLERLSELYNQWGKPAEAKKCSLKIQSIQSKGKIHSVIPAH